MTLEKIAYLGVPGVSSETQYLYKKIDSILASQDENYTHDGNVIIEFVKHMMNNRIADGVLYSRLSSKCISNFEEFDELYTDIDFYELGQEYQEHSREEMDNHNSLMILAQELGFACSLDFELRDTANMKFADPKEFIDFTQYREMMSIAEFYTLYSLLLETDILDELSNEVQVDILQNIKESLEVEIEHFEEFFDYSEVGKTKFIDYLSIIKDVLEEGF